MIWDLYYKLIELLKCHFNNHDGAN
jgi:hypothetical protein